MTGQLVDGGHVPATHIIRKGSDLNYDPPVSFPAMLLMLNHHQSGQCLIPAGDFGDS